MAHVQKHPKAVVGHMLSHYKRDAKNMSNEKIDKSKTKLNYNLAVHQELHQLTFLQQRLSEVHCQNRKDVNVMVSWVVTAPKDLPLEDHKQFFKSSYDFLENRYGKENVISAYVHCDESQPHLHFAFVPVVYDKKKERHKVSAKEKVTRRDLQTFHQDLTQYLQLIFGRDVGVLNEATKDRNKSIEELKRKKAEKDLDDLKKSIQKGIQNYRNLQNDLNIINTEYRSKKSYLEIFVQPMQVMDGVTEKKGLNGKPKRYEVSPEKFEEFKICYENYYSTKKLRTSVEDSLSSIKKNYHSSRIKDLENQNEYLNQELKTMLKDVDSLEVENQYLENALSSAERKLEDLPRRFTNVLDLVLQDLPEDVSENIKMAWNEKFEESQALTKKEISKSFDFER